MSSGATAAALGAGRICADPLKNADALLFAADKPVILVETAGVSDMREVVRLVNLLREGHGSVAGAVIR